MIKNIVISGYGNVAKELVWLMEKKRDVFVKQYGMKFKITTIIGRSGMIYDNSGINLSSLLSCGVGSKAIQKYANLNNLEVVPTQIDGDVLIECAPTDVKTGNPGLKYITEALNKKMDIVCLSKGALVHSFQALHNLARSNQCQIKYSGATAAALPTIDIGDISLAGTTITKISGILNGTSNYILDLMNRKKIEFNAALAIAVEKGIAETNPKLDVSGFDSAAKILLLTNGIFKQSFKIEDVSIRGIENISEAEILTAKNSNKIIKLIASTEINNGKYIIVVEPKFIDESHPLAHVNGTNKGILFESIEMGTICVTGGASHPRAAAAAALKDLINLKRNK